MFSLKRTAALAALIGVAAFAPAMVSAAGPLDGLTIPPVDPAIGFVAPTPDQPNYEARVQAFLQIVVPDEWNGVPVQFLSTLNDAGVDVVGLPTSAPKADPNNPNFVYLRFKNAVLFYNAADDSTQVLPLG